MDAYVNECTEVGDVSDGAFKHHVWAQVAQIFYPFFEACGTKFRAGIAPGFIQFLQESQLARNEVYGQLLANLHSFGTAAESIAAGLTIV